MAVRIDQGDEQRQVSIGRVKRDISELVNRVAFGGERIVLTSRGKPKAALVGLENLRRIEDAAGEGRRRSLAALRQRNDRLVAEIRQRTGGGELPIDEFLDADRSDLEERHDRLFGR